MKRSPFAQALNILARRRRSRNPHLSQVGLLTYRHKRFTSPEVETVQDHLSVCMRCADRYLAFVPRRNGHPFPS